MLIVGVGLPVAWSAFSGSITNPGNSIAASAAFPTYPQAVAAQSPWAYHRGDESASSAATLTAADSSANNRPGTYHGTTNGPSTWWKLNENSGTSITDSSGAANAGTATNGPTWVTGTSGSALNFDGSNDYLLGARAAVHTDRDFTVAAWVNPASVGGATSQSAVSQSGTHTYGFSLGYDGTTRKWAFSVPLTDSVNPTLKIQYSSFQATTGWIHLTGVYSDSLDRILLYVDGNPIGNAALTTDWDATGVLQAGQSRWNDTDGSYPFAGKIDDVRMYQRALSATEILGLATDRPATGWDFSESVGSASTADLGVKSNTGTLGTGASPAAFTASGHSGNGVTMSGSANGYVQGDGSAVHTNSSFTVAAWVYLNASPSGTQVAVSQKGSASSGFMLRYDSGGNWGFAMPQSDAAAPTVDQKLSSSSASTAAWVHLAGVYDDSVDTISLYVGGTDQGTATHGEAGEWDATGALQVGRAWWASAFTYAWNGRVDSVRLYQRALTSTEVTALKNETDPTALFGESAMTAGVPGALQGAQQGETSSTAVAFAGAANAYNNTSPPWPFPTTFTVELWFRVSGTAGGLLIGYADTQTGTAGSHDRMIYSDSGGRITFGTWPNDTPLSVRSPDAYHDGAWHHVAGTFSAANGIKLYVDGALVASDATITLAGSYAGYWRWGGVNIGWGWPNNPSSDGWLVGSIDEVAIYSTELSAQQISWHYHANH